MAGRAPVQFFGEACVKLIAALFATMIIGSSAGAQSVPAKAAADTISPSHLAAAEELLEANDTERGIREGIRAYFDVQGQQNPLIAPYRSTMEEFARKYLVWADLKPRLARVYASTLTENELRAATKFLRTPEGRAFTAHQGELQRAMMQITQEQLQAHAAELQQMIQARAAELDSGRTKKPN